MKEYLDSFGREASYGETYSKKDLLNDKLIY